MLQREASQRPAPTLLDVFEDVVPLTQKPPWYKRKREGGQNTTASKEGVRLISVQVTQRVGWDRLVLRLRSSSGRKPRVRIYRRAGGVLQLYLLNTSIASGVQKGKRVVKHPYSALHSVELKSLATDRRVVVFVRFRSKIPSYQHKRVDGGWEFLFRRTIGD